MIRKAGNEITDAMRGELGSEHLLPGLTSGLLLGVTEVFAALSLGSLVFSGELAPYLSYGIGMALFTAAIMLILTSLASRVPGVMGSPQDTSSVSLAVIAAGLARTLSAAGAAGHLTTVLVAIAATTLLTGLFFLLLGAFRLGGLVRFVPYPVVGGFLAGTGWLLLQGSFGVMASYSLTLRNLSSLVQPDQLLLWLPGVVFALVLFFGLRRIHHFLAMPGILVGAIVLLYLGLLATGTSVDEAVARGLLLGSASGEAVWQPLTLGKLPAADWAAILGQAGNIAIVLILSVVGLLLNASALELAIRRDVDLNRELRAAGLANLLSGLGGGMVGYHALSLSTLSYRIGARGRLSGLVAGTVCAGLLFAGSSVLTYFPKPILGGLLFFLGLDFLVDWVIAAWRKLSHAEYAIVLLILILMGAVNLLTGVALGLLAMIVLFVLNYSRINVVHQALSGAEMHSNLQRCAHYERVLATELGERISILELQGYLFFGTANALLERIRDRLAEGAQPLVRFIILDFRRVSGLDSSAALCFDRAKQLADAAGTTLVLTHLPARIRSQLSGRGLFVGETGARDFADLDRGLEWCEEQLLGMSRVTVMHVPVTLAAQLADSGLAKADTARLTKFLERVSVQEGETLLKQGEEADKLYFIERGAVSVYLEAQGGERVRLQTLGLGTAVGELGLYMGAKCTASVIADSPGTVYRLTRAALARLQAEEPELAATFHQFAARLLSERLAATTRTLEAVLR